MPRIQQLAPDLVSQIAAGEVVERPASAVKELVKNSFDAGDTRIDIAVSGGGADLLRVVDDGCGIHPEDIDLAVAAHAASKLSSFSDLAGVGTLGFRGEAVTSLAALAACHAAVRSGDRLSDGEMEGLLADLDLVRDAHHCPNGRPTAVAFGRRDLERLFQRV